MHPILQTIEQLFELLNSINPTEVNISIKLSEISSLLKNNQVGIAHIVSFCINSCDKESRKYVDSKKQDLNVYCGYIILKEMLSIWERNNILRQEIFSQLEQLNGKQKIILLGDYHADYGVSMFIRNQQDKLLSHGYKVVCIELPCNETIEQHHKGLDSCIIPEHDNENKLHYDEAKRRLSLKDKFDVVFIDPQFKNDFLDDTRIQSTKIRLLNTLNCLREDGMALMILRTVISTNGGIVVQTGLKHFSSMCKKLSDFGAKLIPIIPFNFPRVLFADSIVSEIKQNLVTMSLPELLTLSCTDRECLKYFGEIKFIEQQNLENWLFINRSKFQPWAFENLLLSWASCAPPSGSKIIKGITVVPVTKKPSP